MKIRSRLLTQFVGWFAAFCLRSLTWTLKIEGRWETPETHPGRPTARPYLYALWHDAIVIPIALKSQSPAARVAALVSRHQDGSYLAEFMRYAGIRSIRGSSSQGGAAALRELMRHADHCQIFITPDGPRGPRRELKQGIVFLASQTGMPVIPVASVCANAWSIRGRWTDMTIPKPFSKALFLLGTPISIPPDLSRAELEIHRVRIQAEMDRLDRDAERIMRGEGPASDERVAA